MEEIEKFLKKLSELTKEEEQIKHFTKFCKYCTSNDLKMVSLVFYYILMMIDMNECLWLKILSEWILKFKVKLLHGNILWR